MVKPARYSEDIDFVQLRPGPIGPIFDAIRKVLRELLGEPKRKQTERGVKLIYRYNSIDGGESKLKIEINTTEHVQVFELCDIEHRLATNWFTGSALIRIYTLDELMATKLRALYQRRKGRDLFDVWLVCKNNYINFDRMIEAFEQYCQNDGVCITREQFVDNLAIKQENLDFREDTKILLPLVASLDFDEVMTFVLQEVIARLRS